MLRDLARGAVAAINRSGVPARLQKHASEEPPTAGVKAWIENADDRGGGVYLIWDPAIPARRGIAPSRRGDGSGQPGSVFRR